VIGPGGRRLRAWTARVTLALLAVAAAGCEVVDLEPDTPAPEPQSITECEPPFVLDEETTLAAIGLDDLPGLRPDEHLRRGMFRVTREVIPWEAFGPPGADPVVAEGQMLCITWADGSGLSMLLPEPFGIAADEPADDAATASTWVLPAIVVAALLGLIGISWLAFRDRGGRPIE
jgi:hypothetical protein